MYKPLLNLFKQRLCIYKVRLILLAYRCTRDIGRVPISHVCQWRTPSTALLARTLIVLPCIAPVSYAAEPILRFQSFPAAVAVASDTTRVADHVLIDGKPHPLHFQPLIATGDKVGSEVFGQLKNIKSQPIVGREQTPVLCRTRDAYGAGPDFTSFLRFGDDLFAATQFECAPGAFYVAGLRQDPQNGLLKVHTLNHVDTSNVRGVATLCAGMVTPWGTHLGGEEYDANAALLDEATGVIPDSTVGFNMMGAYFGNQKEANPYDYGWITELRVTTAAGSAQVDKHYALGRFSHELAYVMPDQKTVYLSDDGAHGGLYLFIADKAADLSAGRLYAAKWRQRDDLGSSATLQWLDLGHAKAHEIESALSKRVRFKELFDYAAPDQGAQCPEGFTSTRTVAEPECLRVRPGNETIASRLESRRYAALRGATTEFRKAEGLAYDTQRNAMYLALSEIGGAMLDKAEQDRGGSNDIRLSKNACGAVYELALAADVPDDRESVIRSRYVAVSMQPLIAGLAATNNSHANGTACAADGIANPDNLTYVPEADALLIAEDTDLRQPSTLWAYELPSRSLLRLLTAPKLAEITSIGWYPNVNGWSYITVVVQHPLINLNTRLQDLPPALHAKAESVVGYLGPFPGFDSSGKIIPAPRPPTTP